MKPFNISTFIFVLLLLFLAADFSGYRFLREYIRQNHEKETQILFYKIKIVTDEMVTKLMHEHDREKEKALAVHRKVAALLQNADLNVSLEKIHEEINADDARHPYDIYLADRQLVIRNTTFPADKGFDLSFAKKIFEEHFQKHTIGYSAPIQEKATNSFFSYTDGYLERQGDPKAMLLQTSYRYHDVSEALDELKKIIQKNTSVSLLKIYAFVDQEFTYEIVLKNENRHAKPDSQTLERTHREGEEAIRELGRNTILTKEYTANGTPYRMLLMATRSGNDSKMVVVNTVTLDDTAYHDELRNLNIAMALLTLFGMLGIVIVYKVRSKEVKLSEQDAFVQSAMHEIKTPLSIISLNNELRTIEKGEDEYSREIDSAIRTLQTSYDAMSFIMTRSELSYPVETLSLAEVLRERIAFFERIAETNDKTIRVQIDNDLKVKISHIELVRLIDNNLSNAIKYSAPGSTITVTLKGNVLSFQNTGTPIEDTKKIFEKYVRENRTVGGYGLGLDIVSQIAKRYGIAIEVHSDTKNGTHFSYTFREAE